MARLARKIATIVLIGVTRHLDATVYPALKK